MKERTMDYILSVLDSMSCQSSLYNRQKLLSSIQLHSGGQILPFSWAENSRPPSPVWTTYYGVRRC